MTATAGAAVAARRPTGRGGRILVEAPAPAVTHRVATTARAVRPATVESAARTRPSEGSEGITRGRVQGRVQGRAQVQEAVRELRRRHAASSRAPPAAWQAARPAVPARASLVATPMKCRWPAKWPSKSARGARPAAASPKPARKSRRAQSVSRSRAARGPKTLEPLTLVASPRTARGDSQQQSRQPALEQRQADGSRHHGDATEGDEVVGEVTDERGLQVDALGDGDEVPDGIGP